MPDERIYTDASTRVIHFAQEEAKLLGSTLVGTEHLLLGLVREGDGIAAQVLSNIGLTVEQLRRMLDNVPKDSTTSSKMILSSNGKKALESSLQEAQELNRKLGIENFVDTEHLLLGILTVEECKTQRILTCLNIDISDIRSKVISQTESTAYRERRNSPK